MQRRYWNFKDDDATKDLNRWMNGILPPGVYFGFDFNPTANLNLSLVHTSTGFKDVDSLEAESNFKGLLRTRHGAVITEDGSITVGAVGAGHATLPRIDIVVCTYTYDETPGGSTAFYSIIAGTPNASPVAPALANALTQIKIGELYIPATTTLLTGVGVVWTRSVTPTFSNQDIVTPFIGGTDITYPDDLDTFQKVGIYAIRTLTPVNAPFPIGNASSADQAIMFVQNQGVAITQTIISEGGVWAERSFALGLPINHSISKWNGVHIKKMESGPWNMDTTDSISFAHGLNSARIRRVWAIIVDDSTFPTPQVIKMLDCYSSQAVQGGCDWNTTDIILERLIGGIFDNSSYDFVAGPFNRALVFIEYNVSV